MFRYVDEAWQDVRHTVRSLRRVLGFTSVAVATLALGIGANTPLFSVANAVFLKPLSVPHPERLGIARVQEVPGVIRASTTCCMPFETVSTSVCDRQPCRSGCADGRSFPPDTSTCFASFALSGPDHDEPAVRRQPSRSADLCARAAALRGGSARRRVRSASRHTHQSGDRPSLPVAGDR